MPIWIHADLHPGNLLVESGRVCGVLDFGDLTAGDPATDLSIAWMVLPPSARGLFRASASRDPIDDDTWLRARGWALLFGLLFLANHPPGHPMRRVGQATIDAALQR